MVGRVKPPRPNRYRTHWAGRAARRRRSASSVRVAGWVHRRRDHGGLIFIDLRDRTGLLQLVFRPEEAPEAHAGAGGLRGEDVITRERRARAPRRGRGQPRPADRRGRARGGGAGAARRLGDAAVPDRRGRPGGRGASPPLPLPRPPQGADARQRDPPPRGRQGDPRLPLGRGLPGGRDADHDPLDPRGRARLPGAEPALARRLVRAAAVAPALQAAPDDRRLRALLPDRPLLPRRGLPRRPPARVHPARHGAGVRRGGGRLRGHRPPAPARARARRHRGLAAARADDLRRGDAALRLGPPGPADRRGDRGRDGRVPLVGVQGLPGRARDPGIEGDRGVPAEPLRRSSPRRPSRSAPRASPGRWSRRTAPGARRSPSSCPRRRSRGRTTH